MKMRFWYMILLWTGICLSAMGQTEGLPQGHPRYLTNADGKQETLRLIKEEAWAQDVFDKLKQRTDRYADRGEDWLSSRLQMYWNTRATEVYIKGEVYDQCLPAHEAMPLITAARS